MTQFFTAPATGIGANDINMFADEEGHLALLNLIDSMRYLSVSSRVEKEQTQELNIHQRTAGSFDIRLRHEYIPDHIAKEDPSLESTNMINGFPASGRDRLNSLFAAVEVIDEHKFALSENQTAILYDAYIAASLQKIFGDELIGSMDFIFKLFTLSELFEDIMVMMRRRGGKSVITSVFIIAFGMTQLSGNFNVFGKSKRITKMMKDLVKEMFYTLKNTGLFEPTEIIEDNDERFAIRTRFGTINRANFYPCSTEVHHPIISLHIKKL